MDWFWLDRKGYKSAHWGERDPQVIATEIRLDEVRDDIKDMQMTAWKYQGVVHVASNCYNLTQQLKAAGKHAAAAPAVLVPVMDIATAGSGGCPNCTKNTWALIARLREIPVIRHAVQVEFLRRAVAGAEAGTRARSATGRHNAVQNANMAQKLLNDLGKEKLEVRYDDAVEELRKQLDVAVRDTYNMADQSRTADQVKFETKLRKNLGLEHGPVDGTLILGGIHQHTIGSNRDIAIAVDLYSVAPMTGNLSQVILCPMWVWNWLSGKQRIARHAAAMTSMPAGELPDEVISMAAALYDPGSPTMASTISGAVDAADGVLNTGKSTN